MGLNLADVHAAFLKKYRQKTQHSLWHTLLDDGYIHQYLVWHLEKAGQIEEIHQLLREESATGSNGWYEVREQLAQTAGYITNISRAWELAEANWTESTLSLQCRYALITASMNSLAANLPANLLVALVKNKMWTPEQGLAYALQNPKPQEKVNSLIELVNYLPPNLQELALQKALVTARVIQDEDSRAKALSALAQKLPQVLPEALAAAKAIKYQDSRTNALSALAQKLPQVLPEALAAARAIQHEHYGAKALSALARILPPELLPEALAAARAIKYEDSRADALSALAQILPDLLPEVLAAARAIQHEYCRANTLSALAQILPPELLPKALAAARAIESELFRAKALSALAQKLPPELLPEALAAARAIESESSRAEALSALAQKLPQVLPEALTAARAIQPEYHRAGALSALAQKLPQVLPEALAAARAIQNDEYHRADILSVLADNLSQMPTAELFSPWQDTLHELSLGTRPNLLQDIKVLFPVIFALGDETTTLEIARAIQDVARWWK